MKDKTVPVAMREGEIPVPIPNTTVKTFAADGTMLETAWESRRLPGLFESRRLPGLFYKRIRFRSDEGREQQFQFLMAAEAAKSGCRASADNTLKTE